MTKSPGKTDKAISRAEPTTNIRAPMTNRLPGRKAQRTAHITAAWVKVLGRVQVRTITYDEGDKHFAVEQTPAGNVNFVCSHPRIPGSRHKVGNKEGMTVEVARKEVKRCVGILESGGNPWQAEAKTPQGDTTVKQAIEHYVARLEQGQRHRMNGAPMPARGLNRLRRCWLGVGDDDPTYPVSHLHNRRWQDLTPDEIEELHTKVRNAAGHGTANEVLKYLRTAIRVQIERMPENKRPPNPCNAMKERGLWKPPVTGTKAPKRKVESANPLTTEDLRGLVAVLSDWPDEEQVIHPIVTLLALLTGMRRSQVMSLRRDHIDEEGKFLVLAGTDNRKALGREFKFPITSTLRKVIDRCNFHDVYLTPGRAHKKAEFSGHVNSDEWWRRAFELGKVKPAKGAGVHRLRDTMITWLSANVSPAAASWLCDHTPKPDKDSGQAVTLRHYTDHDKTGDSRKWAEKYHQHLRSLGLKV